MPAIAGNVGLRWRKCVSSPLVVQVSTALRKYVYFAVARTPATSAFRGRPPARWSSTVQWLGPARRSFGRRVPCSAATERSPRHVVWTVACG